MRNSFHFKAFLNFLSKNKLYTAINIFGFAASLMFVILLGLYIQKERTVDSFHENKDRIYRLEHAEGARFTGALQYLLKDRYPEIEHVIRVTDLYDLTVNVSGREPVHSTAWALMTDPEFFSMFSFPFVEGDASSALRTKYDVVLTESYARQLFGAEPAVGQSIKVNEYEPEFIVSAVVADVEHSHLNNPSLFIPVVNLNDWWNIGSPGITEHLAWDFIGIYIQTYPGTDLPSQTARIESYFKDDLRYPMFAEGRAKEVKLRPLEEIYYHQAPEIYYTRSNSKSYMTVLTVVGLVILIFAVINYINLSVAQTGFRAKAAAMRRLLGGTRGEVFREYISESTLMCFVSLVLGLLLAIAFQPFFRQLMNTDISVIQGMTWSNVSLLVAGVILLGVVSGVVPASVVAGFRAIEVVRGTFQRKTKMVYSKVLISFQYCITIILIGCTLTIIGQVSYMLSADMGFEKDYILMFNTPVEAGQQGALRDRLMALSGVEQVGFARGGPRVWGHESKFKDRNGDNHQITYYHADSLFMKIMGFDILHRTGQTHGYWLNETAWRRLGMQQGDIDYRSGDEEGFEVAGMIKDFHFHGFDREIGEAAIIQVPLDESQVYLTNTYVKVSAGDPFGTRDRVMALCQDIAGGKVVGADFMDEWLESTYWQQKRLVRILGTLSVLAIIISSLGLLAMATYFARQKAQEVAVRKIFGAMSREVLVLLMANFMKLVAIAFVIAVPVIFYLMRDWLTGYVYRIPLSWSIFAMAGLIALLLAASTVFWQLLKTAHTNPILSLRNR